jgi:hypothetical protein
MALLFAAPPAASAQASKSKKYAVIIGVGDYTHKKLLNDLPFPVNDAADLSEILQKNAYEVTLLSSKAAENMQPTKTNIEREVDKVLKKAGNNDFVVFAFAGHGLEVNEEPYLCPRDAVPPDPNGPEKEQAQDKETLVSVKDIFRKIGRSRAGGVVVFMDACRKVPQGRKSGNPGDIALPQNVGALYSCRPRKEAFEHDELKHGVFFYCLLKALKGEAPEAKNSKGEITLNALADYLSDEVPKTIKRLQLPPQKPDPYIRFERSPVLVALTAAVQTTPTPVKPPPALAELIEIDLGKDVVLKLKLVKPAEDAPRSIARPFYMGLTPVTQGQYEQIMGKNPSYFSALGGGKKDVAALETQNFPVDSVSWDDAMNFCERASLAPTVKSKGWSFDLPTADEWVYCCRAGKKTPFAFGNSLLATQANFGGNVDRPTRVGNYPANAWGFFDMHGNVWQWTKDTSKAPLTVGRVQLGGSWNDTEQKCRVDYEGVDVPRRNDYTYGFRVVLRVPN